MNRKLRTLLFTSLVLLMAASVALAEPAATDVPNLTETAAPDASAGISPCLGTTVPDFAETAAPDIAALPDALERGAVLEVFDGTQIDLDGDGTRETIGFTSTSPDVDEGKYTLKVNDLTADGEGVCLSGKVYAMRLDAYMQEAYLLVGELGPSDDNACYLYHFGDGKLTYIGYVPSAPGDIRVDGAQFSGVVRGRVLETWFRPADFAIARSYKFDENGNPEGEVAVVEVPRAVYPMGTIVTAKVDLTLRLSPSSGETALTIKKGEKVVLTATDDVAWLYVTAMSGHEQDDFTGGWLRVKDGSVVVGKQTMNGADVFDGLFFAD